MKLEPKPRLARHLKRSHWRIINERQSNAQIFRSADELFERSKSGKKTYFNFCGLEDEFFIIGLQTSSTYTC